MIDRQFMMTADMALMWRDVSAETVCSQGDGFPELHPHAGSVWERYLTRKGRAASKACIMDSSGF